MDIFGCFIWTLLSDLVRYYKKGMSANVKSLYTGYKNIDMYIKKKKPFIFVSIDVDSGLSMWT